MGDGGGPLMCPLLSQPERIVQVGHRCKKGATWGATIKRIPTKSLPVYEEEENTEIKKISGSNSVLP